MYNETKNRKQDHIQINLGKPVNSSITNGFERYRLIHSALPELNLADVEMSATVFNRKLNFPLLISSMTGGTEEAELLNQRLARAAQQQRIAMAVGSQRILLESDQETHGFNVREIAPDILLFGNIGAVQLNFGFGADDCQRLVDIIGADGLFLHLNPLQEALQPEGDTDFTNLLLKIEQVVKQVSIPVIVKEIGWGIHPEVTKRLLNCGVAGVDVAGAGGTSWSQVEMYRLGDPKKREVAAQFQGWGLPTASLIAANKALVGEKLLIASGGITNGIEITKAIALGANLCGMAGPLLRAAAESEEVLEETIEVLKLTVKTAMFATGSGNLSELAEGKVEHEA